MNAGGRDSLTRARDALVEMLVGEAERSARAVPAVAGRAAARRSRRRRGDRPQAHRAERPQPDGLLRAGDGARRAAAVPGGRRRAGAGGRGLPLARRHEPGDRSRPAAAASRLRVSGARRVRQGHRRLRRSAPARADRRVDHGVSRAGEPVGQEIRGGARPRAQGARRRTPTICGSRASRRRRSGRAARPTKPCRCCRTSSGSSPTSPSPTSRSRRSTSTPSAAPTR